MEEEVIRFFYEYEHVSIFISILISIIVAVLGVIPSYFVTAANLMFFGFWMGTFLSFLGEAAGAIVAFYLYRKGLKRFSEQPLKKYPKVNRLIHATGKEAFYLILSLRLIPFVPSGLVTFAGAIGSVSFLTFILASSIGKLPALLLEAYAVYQVTQFEWQAKWILSIAGVTLLWIAWKKTRKLVTK